MFKNLFKQLFRRDTTTSPYTFGQGAFNTALISLAPTLVEIREAIRLIASDPATFYDIARRIRIVYPHTLTEFQTRRNTLTRINFTLQSSERVSERYKDELNTLLRPIRRKAIDAIQLSLRDGIAARETVFQRVGQHIIISDLAPIPKTKFAWKDGVLCYSDVGYAFSAKPLTEEQEMHLFAPTFSLEGDEEDADRYGGLFRYVAIMAGLAFFTIMENARLVERIGRPIRVGRYPVGTNPLGAEATALKEAVWNMGKDLGAVLPEDMTLEVIDVAGRIGTSPAEEILRRIDAVISRIYNGQSLTTQEAQFGTRAQAIVHEGTQADYFDADMERAEVYLQQLANRLWFLNISQSEPCPLRVAAEYRAPKDMESLANVVETLQRAGAGSRIPVAWVNNTFDIPIPQDGEETLQ